MNVLRMVFVSSFAVSLVLVTACSSSKDSAAAKSKQAAATGAPKAKTSKQPPSAPKPSKKSGGNVSGNQSSAAPVEADPECTAEEDGLAVCADTFAVFCAGGKVYALDCSEAFGGTCGELDDGTVDCVVTVEE